MPRALDVVSPGSVPIIVGVGREEMMSNAAAFPDRTRHEQSVAKSSRDQPSGKG